MKTKTRLLLLLTVSLSGCAGFADQFASTFGQLVTVPQTNRTPPNVTLTVVLDTGSIVLGPKDQTFQLDRSASVFIVAIAEDAGGVKSVGFDYETTMYCAMHGTASSPTPEPLSNEWVVGGGPGSQAVTRLWLPKLFEGGLDASCEPGSFAAVGVRAKGSNFSNVVGYSPYATLNFGP
ncbi:hypothetical protein [Burkholderia ubonensis]|uniref:hypothetical protein n=1 Tax=Burkholderia ubonensis TaxID=101571 RepID=UPI0012F7B493|nr:hypothetical protein [Burkholderia ubonensis]